jgi:hypothetical protein
MILKIFSQKKIAKNGVLTQNKTKLCKFLIITLDYEKNATFFAKNWQKSQKIVIITSTSDWAIFAHLAIVYFRHFMKITKLQCSQVFWLLLPRPIQREVF